MKTGEDRYGFIAGSLRPVDFQISPGGSVAAKDEEGFLLPTVDEERLQTMLKREHMTVYSRQSHGTAARFAAEMPASSQFQNKIPKRYDERGFIPGTCNVKRDVI